jgi:type III secretion protein C
MPVVTMCNFSRALLCLLSGWGVLLSSEVVAEEHPSWYSEPYHYVLVDQDIRAALGEFGRNLGLILVLSEKVRGKSRGNIRAETAGQFLTQLSDSNNLSWYFDGNVFYVNSDDEVATRLFNAKSLDVARLMGWLSDLQVFGKHLSLRTSPGGEELFVSGPPPYLALIQQHIENEDVPVAVALVRERGVRVFRGSAVTEAGGP